MSGVTGDALLFLFVDRKRILNPHTQHEYREAACTHTHEMLSIRTLVGPKEVLSFTCINKSAPKQGRSQCRRGPIVRTRYVLVSAFVMVIAQTDGAYDQLFLEATEVAVYCAHVAEFRSLGGSPVDAKRDTVRLLHALVHGTRCQLWKRLLDFEEAARKEAALQRELGC